MAERSHGVIDNYRPGVMDRLGLGYEATPRSVIPKIVAVSASAFGADWDRRRANRATTSSARRRAA